MWWSPQADRIAFLKSDEADVEEYRLQYYNPSGDAFQLAQYPKEVALKYPKPGTPNPLVSVHIYDMNEHMIRTLEWAGELPREERLITEVAWIGPTAFDAIGKTSLLVKEVARAAREGHVIVFEEGQQRGTVTRQLGNGGEEGDKGWIDHVRRWCGLGRAIWLMSTVATGPKRPGAAGPRVGVPRCGADARGLQSHRHVPANHFVGSDLDHRGRVGGRRRGGRAGCRAESAVRGQRPVFNIGTPLISIAPCRYFLAAKPSTERRLHSARIPTSGGTAAAPELTALTDSAEPAYYAASFSPGGGYYVLGYQGPGIPWQKLVKTEEPGSCRGASRGSPLLTAMPQKTPSCSRTTVHSTRRS